MTAAQNLKVHIIEHVSRVELMERDQEEENDDGCMTPGIGLGVGGHWKITVAVLCWGPEAPQVPKFQPAPHETVAGLNRILH